MESGGGRSDPRPLTGEEEAIKRNTDCVYFLASPLTCKKGSECEYRHSEGARVNPRDCKFWFSGKCLNPKCLFRHPPLDGLVGNPVATSGPVMTASQVTASMHLPTLNSSAYNLNKNNVPCYYFQMGTCLKGDKCPFMHFPHPPAKPVEKQIAKVSTPVSVQLEAHKKDAWKIKECSNQQNLSNALSLPVKGAPSSARVNIALENFNNHSVHKSSLLPFPTRNGLPISQTAGVLVSSSTSFSRPRSLHAQSVKLHLNDREAGEILEEPSGIGHTELKRPLNQLRPSQYQNDKWVEEVFRESSPGFDVLVDNVVDDIDYLHKKDGFNGEYIQGGRKFNHHSGHDSATRLDRVRHYVAGDEDRHGTNSISDRILNKPVLPLRRPAHMLGSPDEIDESDLRHRLIKHRRLNGSLSATVSGRESEPYSRHELKMQDRYTHNSSRDQRQLLPENSISSRLRGRITLPRASSPEFSSDLRGGSWGRHRDRLSPVRPSSLQGRLGDRLSRRSIEDSSCNARNSGSLQKERDDMDPLDFAGPRSLAELKGAKSDRNSKNIGSIPIPSPEHNGMKSLKAGGQQDSEVSVSFDGPKPLSALLKRNIDTEPKNDAISGINDDRKVPEEIEAGSFASKAAPAPETKSQDVLQASVNYNKVVVEEDQIYIPSEIDQITYEQQDAEDVTEARDAAEDDEVDYTDQRDGEYYYEAAEGGVYNAEDDEIMDPMNIDLVDDDDDEDEEEFAKKLGLIFA